MAGFLFTKLKIEEAYLIENFHTSDNRGSFVKCFEKSIYEAAGIDFHLNETFVSVSAKNVIRGLHFQHSNPQAKLVYIPVGRVFDVIVDLRPESRTFGEWCGYELSGENHHALYIPRGCAHGFVSLEENTIMLYQCDGSYHKETDTGIRFDDPDIGICWPIDIEKAICSDRDLGLMSLKDYLISPMQI